MCGRFTLTATFQEIVDRFDIEKAIQEDLFNPSYNIAPSQPVLSVINDGSINRLGYLKWGLVPSWAKDEKIGFKLINARAETLSEKPSFREAFKKRRCLVIADSFYEWKCHDDKNKTPMRIKLKSNGLFAMAGLWESWKSAKGPIHTCTIITTSPNKLMKGLHDRMPVILQKEEEQSWLDPKTDIATLHSLLKPYSDGFLEAHQVSPLVNSPKNNTPELMEEII